MTLSSQWSSWPLLCLIYGPSTASHNSVCRKLNQEQIKGVAFLWSFSQIEKKRTNIAHWITLPHLLSFRSPLTFKKFQFSFCFLYPSIMMKYVRLRTLFSRWKKLNLLSPSFLKNIQADRSNSPNFQRKVKIQVLSLRKRHT